MTKKSTALSAALLFALVVFAAWYGPQLVATGFFERAKPQSVARAPAVPAPPSAPDAPPAQPAPPAEQTGEQADSESGLERILPRQSVAREAGLHRTRDPLRLGSSAALVMDLNTRQVLYSKNEAAVLPMASLTKLMTGLLIVQSRLPLDEVITITEADVDTERSSRSRLRVGSSLTRGEALRLALMSSENRAAHALGRTYPGGLEAFVKAMNDKARELGMNNTAYVDPTGLSASNRSTARDLAMLTAVTSRYELLRDYSTTKSHLTELGKRRLQYVNSNSLVRSGWDISLQKTGYIIEAGHCVAMRTTAGGRDVVMVLLDAGNNRDRNVDAQRIRRWLGGGPTEEEVAAAKPRKERKAVAKAKAKPDKDTKVAAKGGKQATKTAAKAKRADSKVAEKPRKSGSKVAAKKSKQADSKLAAGRQQANS